MRLYKIVYKKKCIKYTDYSNGTRNVDLKIRNEIKTCIIYLFIYCFCFSLTDSQKFMNVYSSLRFMLALRYDTHVLMDTRSGNILLFLLPLFQEGQLSVTGESMCTKYWLTA